MSKHHLFPFEFDFMDELGGGLVFTKVVFTDDFGTITKGSKFTTVFVPYDEVYIACQAIDASSEVKVPYKAVAL
jgi:hypothetical protein